MRKKLFSINLFFGLSFHVSYHTTGWEDDNGKKIRFDAWAEKSNKLNAWNISVIVEKVLFDIVKI